MKKTTVFLAVIMLLALTVVSVFANYTSISGTLHDSKTASPWIYGGTAKAYDCSDAGKAALVPAVTIAVDGTFSIAGLTNPGAFRALCVEFDYSTATSPNGTPPTKTNQFIYDDNGTSGNFDMGTIYTDSGPTAVTLQNVTADSNTTAFGMGFVVLMLAGVTFVMFRRREVA